jgi:hypothetical protein
MTPTDAVFQIFEPEVIKLQLRARKGRDNAIRNSPATGPFSEFTLWLNPEGRIIQRRPIAPPPPDSEGRQSLKIMRCDSQARARWKARAIIDDLFDLVWPPRYLLKANIRLWIAEGNYAYAGHTLKLPQLMTVHGMRTHCGQRYIISRELVSNRVRREIHRRVKSKCAGSNHMPPIAA